MTRSKEQESGSSGMRRPVGGEMGRYQRARRLVIALLILVLFTVLVFGSSTQSELIHDRIEAYGVILILLGIGGRLWSILYIGGRKSSEIVTTGPYSITRNPLYLFSSVAAGGAGAQMGSYVALAGFALLCVAAFHVVILREERYLIALRGDRYVAYLKRVPRFFPNPALYTDQDEVTFRPRILRQTLVDGLIFFLSIPIFELIETQQEAGVIPVLFHLY